MFESNIDAGPIGAKSEAIRPFDDHNGVLCERIFESKRFEIGEIFDAVEIDVIDLARRRARLVRPGPGRGARLTTGME